MDVSPELGNMFGAGAMLPGDCRLEWRVCSDGQMEAGRAVAACPSLCVFAWKTLRGCCRSGGGGGVCSGAL